MESPKSGRLQSLSNGQNEPYQNQQHATWLRNTTRFCEYRAASGCIAESRPPGVVIVSRYLARRSARHFVLQLESRSTVVSPQHIVGRVHRSVVVVVTRHASNHWVGDIPCRDRARNCFAILESQIMRTADFKALAKKDRVIRCNGCAA